MTCGFCESALSNSAGTLLVDCVVKPIGNQLSYFCRFNNNVEMLMEKKDDLMRARVRLQHEIDEAKRQHQEIEDDVRDFLSKANKILSDITTLENEILQDKRCFNCCPNWRWRYRLSKKAMKNTLVIRELLEKATKFGQPGRVGYHSTRKIPTIEFFSSKDFMVSESSKKAFNQIIDALQDDDVSLIGLWGMGGVGKTTLVREVGNQAKKLNLFDKVVITTVSHKPNFETIQDEIEKYVDFGMKDERGRRSTQELWLKLQMERKILIILDDVWKNIDLKEKIGIPENSKGCKILLTTRRQQVCVGMECQKTIPLGCLDEQEAWSLFAKKAGLNYSTDHAIKDVATKVVKRCEGLPIALVTLGSALKGKKHHRWEAAYQRLKDRRLVDIEDIEDREEKNVYECLEVSFDYLKETETKICFLLCSLFPEDYEIYVEDLVRYAWGLELYKGMDSIEKARSEVLTAIDILKDSCLLLNVGEKHVKMHDMVRDFALWIASHRKEISFVMKSEVDETWPKDERLEPYVAISFLNSRIVELPKELVCPNLKILLLDRVDYVITPSEFFEGMEALKVCALRRSLISLDAFQSQTNLRTLHLERCKLTDISVIGKMKKLDVLSFSGSFINELPEELGDLNNLKLLDLSYCKQLQRIPPQLFRRLSKLEELCLHGCGFRKWATEKTIQEQSSASLSELSSLSNLTVLSLEVLPEHLPRDFVFHKLQRFYVCVRRFEFALSKRDFETSPFSRSLEIEESVFEACKPLIVDTESLKLTSLGLESCEYIKCLVDTAKQQALTIAFSNLLELSLKDLVGLEELCCGDQPQGFLEKLKTLLIHNCMEIIGGIPVLQNLEKLEVNCCDKMPELFQAAELRSVQEGPSHPVSLQSLKLVEICSCSKLRYLFPTSVAKSLGQLETLKISDCLELEEIIPKTEVSSISLQSLREVHVRRCNKLTSLSSLSHGQSLENLITLEIRSCFGLEYTFPISMAEGLPQLNRVALEDLPRLKGRDGNDVVLTLPSLKRLEVSTCLQLIPFIVSAKIKDLSFTRMTEKKQRTCSMMVPELRERSSNMEHLTITNFEQLFDDGYNLSSLQVLVLHGLPELQVIWKGSIHVENFQNLTRLDVQNCNKLRYILSPTIARNLPQLSSLWIERCRELEGIIEKDDQTSSQYHHLQPICFPNLTIVDIRSCGNLKSLFPISVAHRLPKLRALSVYWLDKLEQVFEQGDEANVSNDKEKLIQLPQLERLRLGYLPSLVSFIPVGYHFVFPSLVPFKVTGCPNIRTSFRVSDEQQTGHAKTEPGPSIGKSIVELEESSTTQETTWPTASNIWWKKRGRKMNR